jgi:hypothetical protein
MPREKGRSANLGNPEAFPLVSCPPLAYTGRRFLALALNREALSPVFAAGLEVITQLRLVRDRLNIGFGIMCE